jgi:D-threo-aldose 1-dehydrogenase
VVPRRLGNTGLFVTPLCIGAARWGGMPNRPDYRERADVAISTMLRLLDSPINFVDTSNEYAEGDSERLIGRALEMAGGPPATFVVATKIDPLPYSSDYSGDRVAKSVSESQERLGIQQLPLVYLHDPERISFAEATAHGGPVEALAGLREQGVVRHIGVAGGPIDLIRRYLATGVFDVVISHNRYTLVDQSAQGLLEDAIARGIAFVNAAPFGGGILAKGLELESTYAYQRVTPVLAERIRSMWRVCTSYGVPPAAAALQFSLRDERIASTIVGISSPERVTVALRLAEWPIPEALWKECGLIGG